MNDKLRSILSIGLIVFLALSAFSAGYFTNDYIEQRNGAPESVESADFGLFWEAWRLIEDNFLGELPSAQQLSYGAIRGAIQLLDDPYTVFVEPPQREEERNLLQGSFGGIGATLSRPEAGGAIFLDPIPENPAALAGVVPGDTLVAVDGVEITSEMTIQQVIELIRGDKGTAVTLTVLHPGALTPVDIEIIRNDILIPSVSFELLQQDPTIGYIQLSRFSGESGQEVKEAIIELQTLGAEKLILDLRGNGGGLLDAAVDVSDHFLEGGPVMYQQVRGEGERVYEATSDTVAEAMPLVVLIDGGTASAAEIVAGALQDRERARLIGSSGSFGKGSVQLVFDLSDGSSVHVTSSRWFTPQRNEIDQMGLTPDVMVEIKQDDIDNGRDVVLIEAIKLLQDE